MRKFLLFAAVAALLSLPTTASATSSQQSENGKERPAGNTAQAIFEQKKLANAGDTDAQYRLGEMLFQNYSIVSAKKWLEKAAAGGNLLAEARLFYIRFCFDQKSDSTKKFNKFEKLAALESDDAKILLGDFYLAGCGVTKDKRRAIAYFTSAAQNDDPRAQLSLAIASGDPEKAFKMIKIEAEQGNAPAQDDLATAYAEGIGTPKDPQKALEWYHKAAEQGHVNSQTGLGLAYHSGKGTKKDPQKAFMWFHKAAEQGDTVAQCMLGIYYDHGIGTQQDKQKAFIWYHKSAEQGDADSQFRLAFFYTEGIGTPKDEQKAFKWYHKAAEQGHVEAQTGLGLFYYNGIGTKKDPKKACLWFQKAAEQGDAIAQTFLGILYESGIGVPEDLEIAIGWYLKAAAQGEELAQKRLHELKRLMKKAMQYPPGAIPY